MNCFEWQSKASDYLDDLLSETQQKESDAHLESCTQCNQLHQHYRIILTTISSQPRMVLPTAFRKAPFRSSSLPIRKRLSPKVVWQLMPWYLRTTLEGAVIVLILLLAISVGPKVRQLYEREIEKSVSEFQETFQESTGDSPLAPTKDAPPLLRKGTSGNSHDNSPISGEEFADEMEVDSMDLEGDAIGENIRVGSSEIWRFNIKTDSPRDFRDRIVQMLLELKLAKDTPGLGGIEAPGGVQFDLLVPQSLVGKIKSQLQRLAPKSQIVGETFAWYKNKSRKKIPEGRTRVVIWLSQM